MNPSLNSISSPSTVIDLNVLFPVSLTVIRDIIIIEAQEPSYPGIFKFKISGSFIRFGKMDNIFLCIAEDPAQHIKKMNTDICCNTS